jgi:hypothetical protein
MDIIDESAPHIHSAAQIPTRNRSKILPKNSATTVIHVLVTQLYDSLKRCYKEDAVRDDRVSVIQSSETPYRSPPKCQNRAKVKSEDHATGQLGKLV